MPRTARQAPGGLVPPTLGEPEKELRPLFFSESAVRRSIQTRKVHCNSVMVSQGLLLYMSEMLSQECGRLSLFSLDLNHAHLSQASACSELRFRN